MWRENDGSSRARPGAAFWKISCAGAAFQAGASAVDSGTIVAALVYALTGNVYAVGMASAVIRLGWLSPQIVMGVLAQRADRRMPYYIVGAFGRAGCLAAIAMLLWLAAEPAAEWLAIGFLSIWTLYAFVSGVVAVPYNDIVGRSIPSAIRSRMLALRFFVGGVLAIVVAAIVHHLLAILPLAHAYATIFALASALMVLSSMSFVSAGEPPISAARQKTDEGFAAFLKHGRLVLFNDRRFRLFLYTQWLGGATLMTLPFYVVALSTLGLETQAVALMLGAQTAGSLASNAVWGQIGDRFGKLRLLQVVGVIRIVPQTMTLAL